MAIEMSKSMYWRKAKSTEIARLFQKGLIRHGEKQKIMVGLMK